MGYNKLQRKMTAIVYSKKRLNEMAVNTYRNYSEVRDALNIDVNSKKTQVDHMAISEEDTSEKTRNADH